MMVEFEWEDLRAVFLSGENFWRFNPHFQSKLDDACFMCSDDVMIIVWFMERGYHGNKIPN